MNSEADDRLVVTTGQIHSGSALDVDDLVDTGLHVCCDEDEGKV